MQKACLIGRKLGHSLSPEIHRRFYELAEQQGRYGLRETEPEDLKSLLDELKQSGYSGANVTIPYKTQVMQYLDDISDEALSIGAVNTIKFDGGRLLGYNTDYYGLKELLLSNGIEVSGKIVVILGTGGASKCAYKLAQDMGASDIKPVSRSAKKGAITYDELSRIEAIDVLINTTPAGMYPDIFGCPVSNFVIERSECVVDLIYNPMKTQLVRKALATGKKAAGGLKMLTAQAVKAQEIWNGKHYSGSIYEDVYKYVEGLKNNLVITGMPGSGKSSIGKKIADELGMGFIDTDELIEHEHGRIPDIFEKEGEKAFREYEKQAAALAADIRGVVISTGGGIMLKEENIDMLKKTGEVFFIDRPLSELIEKTDGSYRPLIAGDNSRIKALYEQRYPLYNKYADHIVANDTDISECVDKIKTIWEKKL